MFFWYFRMTFVILTITLLIMHPPDALSMKLKIFSVTRKIIVYRLEFETLKSQSWPCETISRGFGVIPAGISPELSRNDNISDFLKLGEIVDTFDIGSLSVRSIYGWKTIVIRLSGGSIYGRDPVHIALPLADEHISIFRASKWESSEIRVTDQSRVIEVTLKERKSHKLDENFTKLR